MKKTMVVLLAVCLILTAATAVGEENGSLAGIPDDQAENDRDMPSIGFTGLTYDPDIYSRSGLILTIIYPNSPAEKAGLRIGDILTKIGDIPFDQEYLFEILGKAKLGDSMQFTVFRPDVVRTKGKELFISVDGTMLNKAVTLAARRSIPDFNIEAVSPFDIIRYFPGFSILKEEQISAMIASWPEAETETKHTEEFYPEKNLYEKDFPYHDRIHTWRILAGEGTWSFSDESDMTVLTVPENQRFEAQEQTIQWEIALLEMIPEIEKSAKEKGIRLIARMQGDRELEALVDESGMINLMEEEKYSEVLKQKYAWLEIFQSQEP